MAVQFRYVAPKVNAAVALAAVAPIAAREGAQQLLDASQPLVPVEHGDLKASGHLEQEGNRVHVIYDATAPDGYPYGIKQHEDGTLHHPHGGQWKYLESPMHSEALAIAARILHTLARVFRL